MKYAIIAAGNGSRLVEEHVGLPKPLVRIGGEMLIERLLRIFMDNGASEIHVICNEQMPEVASFLNDVCRNGLNGKTVPLNFIVQTTPSSMHSLYALSPYLHGDDPFVLTTVDTVFCESEFADYIQLMRKQPEEGCSQRTMTIADGFMVVTNYVDDEKPLYVEVDDDQNIIGFYDTAKGCRYVSGGIYGLMPRCLDVLHTCIERGEYRMRNFQRALVSDGLHLKAVPFSKVLDIDHRSDIEKAEAWLSE